MSIKPSKMLLACQFVQFITVLMAIFITGGFIWVLTHLTEVGHQFALTRGLYFDASLIGNLQKIGLATAIAAPLATMLWGLWRLFRLFQLFATAKYFSHEAVKHLLGFSLMLFITVILSVVSHVLFSVIITLNNPEGLRAVSVSFGSGQFSLLLQAGIFTIIAWVLAEGVRINEENEEFI